MTRNNYVHAACRWEIMGPLPPQTQPPLLERWRCPSQQVSLSSPSWSVGNWSACSRTCGGGTQSRPVHCTRRAHYKSERVSASLCPQPVPSSRQACQSQSCPPAWSTGPWAEVTQAQLTWGAAVGPPWDTELDPHQALQGPWAGTHTPTSPSTVQLIPCWEPTLALSVQCSRTCGKGWRKRSVVCKSTNPSARAQLLPDAGCTSEPKPRAHEACLLKRCHKHKKLQWLVSAWSQVGAWSRGNGSTSSLLGPASPSFVSLLPAPLPPSRVPPPQLQAALLGFSQPPGLLALHSSKSPFRDCVLKASPPGASTQSSPNQC